jgi:hypothetical protein
VTGADPGIIVRGAQHYLRPGGALRPPVGPGLSPAWFGPRGGGEVLDF